MYVAVKPLYSPVTLVICPYIRSCLRAAASVSLMAWSEDSRLKSAAASGDSAHSTSGQMSITASTNQVLR